MHPISLRKKISALLRLVLSVWFVSASYITPVSAATPFQYSEPEEITNREKAHLNITFTGGGNSVDCPPIEDSDTSADSIPGGSNAEKLFVFLRAKGLTSEQAAGIVGNVMQESGGGTFNISPDALNPSSGAYGIIQWYAGRKTALINYANNHNKPKNDLGIQMDFMWVELNAGYKQSVLEPIKASSGLRTPTKIWLERYEIPCLPGSSACAAELNHRMGFTNRAYRAFSGNEAPELSSTTQCEPSTADAVVDANGYAFPVALPKAQISNGYSWPCKTTPSYCHHDGTPGFDLAKKALDDSSAGVPVVAIYDGHIASIDQNYSGTGCQSLQFKGKDGYYYWYGHIRTNGDTPGIEKPVKAGTVIGKIGERRCTGNGSYPHLHIDRGAPKGHTGGEDAHRDPKFIPLMNTLYKNLE